MKPVPFLAPRRLGVGATETNYGPDRRSGSTAAPATPAPPPGRLCVFFGMREPPYFPLRGGGPALSSHASRHCRERHALTSDCGHRFHPHRPRRVTTVTG